MQNPKQVLTQKKDPGKAGIWLAWVLALGFHAMILWLPLGGVRPAPDSDRVDKERILIELQLSGVRLPVPTPVDVQIPEAPAPPPVPEPVAEPIEEIRPESVPAVVKALPESMPDRVEPSQLTSIPQDQGMQRDLENMSEAEKSQLTSTVLMRQFITEESEADRIFGRRIEPGDGETRREFHYPARQSLISMLDKPLPELPFAYQQDLVYFAYDPGVKGDLQRFWDVITPEFGWRTKYGTEVKCVWVLVIAACGWK